jgi:DNA-binding transcriptional LysR family regulator
VLAAAESGVGIALARWPLAAASLQSGRLVRIAGPEIASPNAHYVVTRHGETRSAVLRLAERLIAQAASQVTSAPD